MSATSTACVRASRVHAIASCELVQYVSVYMRACLCMSKHLDFSQHGICWVCVSMSVSACARVCAYLSVSVYLCLCAAFVYHNFEAQLLYQEQAPAHVCMHACMHSCMCVHMYVHMYVCMGVSFMAEFVCTHVCMYVRTYVRKYAFMYVYLRLRIYKKGVTRPGGGEQYARSKCHKRHTNLFSCSCARARVCVCARA